MIIFRQIQKNDINHFLKIAQSTPSFKKEGVGECDFFEKMTKDDFIDTYLGHNEYFFILTFKDILYGYISFFTLEGTFTCDNYPSSKVIYINNRCSFARHYKQKPPIQVGFLLNEFFKNYVIKKLFPDNFTLVFNTSTQEALSNHLKNGMKSVLVDKINLLETFTNQDKKSIFQVMSNLFDIDTFWNPDMNLIIFFKGYNIKNLQDLISDNLILDTDNNKQYYLKQSVESLDRCIINASNNQRLYNRYIN